MNDLENYKNFLINTKKCLEYYHRLKVLYSYLEEHNLTFENLTQQQMGEYFKEHNYSIESINNVIKSCRNYCRFKGIDNHSCFKIKLLKPEDKLVEYISEEEVKKAIQYITISSKRLDYQRIEVILLFLFYTGVRKGELVNLKRKDFNLSNCEVKVYEQKTKKEKILYYPSKLCEKIKIYFGYEPEKTNAFNVTKSQIDYLFRKVISKCLGRKVKPHLTRHGGAKFMEEKGIQVTIIQKILGHKSLNTTLRYLAPDQKIIEKNYKEKMK